jgi:hypothetical protein
MTNSTENVWLQNTRQTPELSLPPPAYQQSQRAREERYLPIQHAIDRQPSFASVNYPGVSEDVYTIAGTSPDPPPYQLTAICTQSQGIRDKSMCNAKTRRQPQLIYSGTRCKDILMMVFAALMFIMMIVAITFLFTMLHIWYEKHFTLMKNGTNTNGTRTD